jgi:hypothetical protein
LSRPKPSAPAWQRGQSGNPNGRPIGSRNKLNEKFILALHDDFAEHGAAVVVKVREERPEIYLKVIASILPQKVEATFLDVQWIVRDRPLSDEEWRRKYCRPEWKNPLVAPRTK